ncbi:hypothetical protein [Pseudalkalibacillus salsuginis]|uniref:hypothetical protein n=1 Tax=Pseudalkalibacillus salsuginis TaxID=2910972 RepID=UPI001F2BF6A6|nr:hypothetical protein [Pseudalkalibacillus salsuginis]MCF6408126.1 hypothetical protein [Pseudalkalibacillus salsuginis]
MKLIKFVFVTLLSLMLFACENSNQSTEEQNPQIKQDDINEKINYGEQISMEKALSVVSFVPKQINRENPPFPLKKTTGIVNKTNKQSEIIELRYGGDEKSLMIEVENTKELKQDSSLKYEKINLLNGEIPYYAIDGYIQYITWINNELAIL